METTSLNIKNFKPTYVQHGQRLTFLFLFKKWSNILVFLAAVLQCIFFGSAENFFAVFCVIVAWRLTDIFILEKNRLHRNSLSSLLILGFSITQYFIPVVMTLVESKPLVFNLNVPYQVFTHSLLSFLVLLIAQHIYISKRVSGNVIKTGFQKLLFKLELFKVPTANQTWIIGFIGLIAMFITYFFSKQSFEMVSEGSGNKFIEGLVPFTYAPYFLLLSGLFSPSKIKSNRLKNKIIGFTVLVVIIGIAGNSRNLFMTGLTAVGIGYFLGLLINRFDFRIFNAKTIVSVGILFWIVTGPLSDIGTAMVIVRAQRGDISKTEMLMQTLEAYKDKEAMRMYKKASKGNNLMWDETYFDNLFLARFSNLKFNDLSLDLSSRIGKVDPMMQQYSIDRTFANLPQPLLDLFSIELDKIKILGSSFGDFLLSRGGGGGSALGGFRVGQFAGVGMASFGWWYLAILGIGIIPVYFLLDLFVIVVKKTKDGNSYKSYISLAGLLSLTVIFTFLSNSTISENVMNLYPYIFRGWIQIVFLYIIVFQISKHILRLLKSVSK